MDDLLNSFYSRGKYFWYWREFAENKNQNIRESIFKILTYQSIILDENGKIKRAGLSAYELSKKSKYGLSTEIPEYQRVSQKASYSNLFTTILPELSRSFLILPTMKMDSYSGQKIPLYILTFNGLIFSLCFFNKNFEHTNEIIDKHLQVMKFYKIDSEFGSPATLLKNFKKLTTNEQKEFFKLYFNIMNKTELTDDEGTEVNKFLWLQTNVKLFFYFQFFLLPAFFPISKKQKEIVRKCWFGFEELFRRSLQTNLSNHIEAYDRFQEKLELPIEDNINIAGRINEKGSGAMLFSISKESNVLMSDYFSKNHNIDSELMPELYRNVMHWATNEFLRLVQSKKEEDKELLDKIVESYDFNKKN